MIKLVNSFILLVIVLGIMQCSNSSNSTDKIPPRALTIAEKGIVSSDNNFGLELFKEVIKEQKDTNVFISPLSVSMALGMTFNGAAGTTREAMQKTLELSGLSIEEINESYQSLIKLLSELDPKVRFQIANSIWYRMGWQFEKEFLDINKKYFNAKVSELDFNRPDASDIINQWVNDNTNGKIKEIVDDNIDPNTVMFLINAIYFKGIWTYQFDKKLTKDDIFYLSDGSKTSCKMMELEGEVHYFENKDFQAVDLPYGDGLYSMTVFLPRSGIDINTLIAKFDNENWTNWINSFKEKNIVLQFPKFKLEYEIKLNDALKALGMEIAFDSLADFTNMYKPGGLFINKVRHKTFIDVYEEGTEAAAVTSVEMVNTSIGTYMRVDRPFIFAIRENHSQTILFIGKIVEPLEE